MEKLKKYCFIFVLVLLFLPIAQSFFNFHQRKPLEGLSPMTNFPTFRYQDWMSGRYQDLAEKYIRDNFGYRNKLLRIINSIDYSLFNTSNSKGIVIGKDGHLFFNYNIERYLGIQKKDKAVIDSLFALTDTVSRKLKEREIEFVYVIAPSNAFYYSDKFPPQYDKVTKRQNDYDDFIENLEKYNIQYIDFNKWFLDIKDTVSIDLFPKHGTHYSIFSSIWVADSLLRYMGEVKEINTPEIIYSKTVIDTMHPAEHDLENLMNLMHSLENEKMIYYDLDFDVEGKTKPKVLTVGDSFYWNILNNLIPLNCFENVTFWFYNDKVYPESFTRDLNPEQINLDSLFNDLDFIFIFASSTLLYHYDYDGFLNRINNYLDDKISFQNHSYQERVNFYIDAIHHNKEWYNSIRDKARSMNVLIDEQILIEAQWMAEQDGYSEN